jgi:hypothetical protein
MKTNNPPPSPFKKGGVHFLPPFTKGRPGGIKRDQKIGKV